ncbi:Transmembrane protein 130 [Amphibalanus amphitrite]|uniref:Transmembrane protein 130 n=1 Tax=Amphibalanus amphitrite TaxID=1232801 RepID=A0A6A4X3S9_AMPAM|nr:Transmembrane protein 130 [Amphibalanus amphitrite]
MLTGLVCILIIPAIAAAARVDLTNDGPAVVGAPIMFTATVLLDPDDDRPDELVYEWSDNASPRHYNKSDPTSSLTATMMLRFDGNDRFGGYYTMTVRVKEPRLILPDRVIGEESTLYSITVYLNGGIELSQPGVTPREPGHVSMMNETLLSVNFHDPHHFIESATKVEYFWSVNDKINLGPFADPTLGYNMTRVGENFVRCIAVAHFNLSTEQARAGDATTKWGLFELTFNVDAPITLVNVSGNNWLKHGELLNLTVHCNGTGPWEYCVAVYTGRYNVTGNETCSNPIPTDDCTVPILRYLRDNGTYTAVSVLSNAVSRRVTPVAITVYTAVRRPQLSYYIIPLSCALAAIAFILFGSIKLIKSNRDYNLEIADFDFSQPGEAAAPPSFGRRLLVSMWPGGARRATGSAGATAGGESDAILPRGRTRRRSYGLVEDYEED